MSEQNTSTKEKTTKSVPTKNQEHKVVAKKHEDKKPQDKKEHSVVKGKKPNKPNVKNTQKKGNPKTNKSSSPKKKHIEFGWYPFAEYFGKKTEEPAKTESKK